MAEGFATHNSSVDHGGYSGGRDRERIDMFLCPNATVARRNLARYPNARAFVIGCPYLDRWAGATSHAKPWPVPPPPTVGISFHWECNMTHETRSGFPYFSPALDQLNRVYRVLGHAHPRAWDTIEPFYKEHGIEYTLDFAEVMDRADVYVVDNSSTGFEFMALDKPVVWLNSPWYRKTTDHGLRFWEWADAGVQCDKREHLVDAVRGALEDHPSIRARREACVQAVYGPQDGRAAERAGTAILEWAGL